MSIKKWAQIKDGTVVNNIIADQDFINQICGTEGEWNGIYQCIDITSSTPEPEIGWKYINGNFSEPT